MKTATKDKISNTVFEQLQVYCNEYKLSIIKITERQFRIFRGKLKIDIFPLSNKYFDITNQKWGVYRHEVDCVDTLIRKHENGIK